MARKDKDTNPLKGLSRRERQALEILFSKGEASAVEIHAAMEDAPSYSAIRALLRILEEKGHVRHVVENGRYIYVPTIPKGSAGRSALDQVITTFFNGSVESVVATLITAKESQLNEDDYERLTELIRKAREEKKS